MSNRVNDGAFDVLNLLIDNPSRDRTAVERFGKAQLATAIQAGWVNVSQGRWSITPRGRKVLAGSHLMLSNP
jgi:hypothetical protein